MTGIVEKNKAEFNKWTKLFRARGHQVISPVENDNGSTDKSWSFYMRLDMESLLQVDAVVLLPGWEFSRGAKLELAIADALQIPCYRVEDFTVKNMYRMRLNVNVTVTAD